jgi:hypothetical protein
VSEYLETGGLQPNDEVESLSQSFASSSSQRKENQYGPLDNNEREELDRLKALFAKSSSQQLQGSQQSPIKPKLLEYEEEKKGNGQVGSNLVQHQHHQ